MASSRLFPRESALAEPEHKVGLAGSALKSRSACCLCLRRLDFFGRRSFQASRERSSVIGHVGKLRAFKARRLCADQHASKSLRQLSPERRAQLAPKHAFARHLAMGLAVDARFSKMPNFAVKTDTFQSSRREMRLFCRE